MVTDTHTSFEGLDLAAPHQPTSLVGVYEVWLDSGAHVFLHDAALVELTSSFGPIDSVVTMMFDFRLGYAPKSLPESARIRYEFRGVKSLEIVWAKEADEDASRLADIHNFLWDGEATFELRTSDMTVGLLAFALRVTAV